MTTSHSPVFAGTATIAPGSIAVLGPEIGGQVLTEGAGKGFIGKDWPNIAKAIGNGIATGFTTANSLITIIGTITTPPPVPLGPIPNTIVPAGALA